VYSTTLINQTDVDDKDYNDGDVEDDDAIMMIMMTLTTMINQ
jgi:hypothetical protein